MNMYSFMPPDTITITGCEGCNGNCDGCYNNYKTVINTAYVETEYSNWLKEDCPF